MNKEKVCLKHPYIETEECCSRCKTPLCPDCRIKLEKRPYCSSWCLYHDKAASAINRTFKKAAGSQSECNTRLVLISDLLIILIILTFTAASLHFKEKEGKPLPPMVAKMSEKATKQEAIQIKEGAVKEELKETPLKKHKKKVLLLPDKQKKNRVKKERQRGKREKVRHSSQSISRVARAGKQLSITFDGGSSDSSATVILDVLSERNIKTTFFLTGKFIKRYPRLVKRMIEEGHEIGNHTYSHPHLTTYSKNRKNETSPGVTFESLKKELNQTDKLYFKLTGKRMAPYWRAPYGEINGKILSWASQIGYQHIAWTVDYKAKKSMDSLDWVADKSSSLYLSAEEIRQRLLSFADDKGRAEGGIILMHLGTERKEDAAHEKLAEIIDDFTGKGYKLVPVSHLVKVMNEANSRKKL